MTTSGNQECKTWILSSKTQSIPSMLLMMLMIAVVSLDAENMYTNMLEDLGSGVQEVAKITWKVISTNRMEISIQFLVIQLWEP